MADATTAIPLETPRTAHPAEPVAAAFPTSTPAGADPVRALPLGYEPPRNRPSPLPFDDVLIFLFRRVVFALGVGLLAFGILSGFATRNYRDSAAMGGWGAGLIALVAPFPALWRHWPRRP